MTYKSQRMDLDQTIKKFTKANNFNIKPIEFHVHTNWTDGENSVKEMHEKACKKGIKAILFSEHVRKTSKEWFKNFANEVRALNQEKCISLVGAETKIIDYRGNLDCSSEIIKDSDLIMGVVHRFPGEEGEIKNNTNGYTSSEAMEIEFELSLSLLKNSPINILGHPLGMTYSRFKMVPSDNKIIELIKLASKNNILFEINAKYHPNPKKILEMCVSYGAKISLGSNAHNVNEVGLILDVLKRKT